MKKQIISVLLIFLIVTIPLSSAQITGTTDPTLQNLPQEVEPAEDILVNVREYQPSIVSSSAFETDDYTGYTVYALLYGLQTNPLIDISKIRSLSIRVQKTNIPGVQVAHRAPPYRYSTDNLGYLLIRLPRIKDERKIPDRIDIDLTANILYDIGSGFGVYEVGKNIPQLSEQDFKANKDKYSFWSGRGYVKADLIEDNRAVFSIYDGRGQLVHSGLSLFPGQESREIFLSSGYFFPGIGEEALRRNLREQFTLKLDSIDVPKDKVSMQVLVNNKFISQELTKNQRLYEGSSWKIRDIRGLADQDIVELENVATNELVTITGSRLQGIECNDYSNSKALCETIKECRYDTTLNKCLSVSQQTTLPTTSKVPTSNIEAEKELITAINEYEKLTSTSTPQNYKDVANLFAEVMRKYPNTVYRATARSYLYEKIYNEKLKNADASLKKDVQNYIGGILKTESINVQIQETKVGIDSKDYYLDAIQSYKYVIQQGKVEGSNKDLEAQIKIAEIYDYYLNDYGNAIQAYNELINNYDISDIEKSVYESRADFLQNVGDYISSPVDLYEDGNLVRVILHGVERVQVKPQAYISVNEQAAKPYFEGDVIDGTTYKIENIQSNKVSVVSTLLQSVGLVTDLDRNLAQQDYNTKNPPKSTTSFTDADYKISKFYGATITETGLDHIPKSINPSSIHTEWGVDVGLGANSDVRPLFNGKVVDKNACSITTDINGFPNYGIKYVHINPSVNIGDNVNPLSSIGKVASRADNPACLEGSTGSHLHLGFLKENNKISLSQFESETRLFSNLYTQAQTYPGQQLKNELILDRNVILDNVNVKLIRLDTKREAHVTIKPVVKALTSVSNFKVHIPIERRLIRLSDEQIGKHIDATGKLINSLNKIIDRIEKIYQYFLAYCIAIITVLLIKKLIQGGARDFARHETIKQWEEYCKSKFGRDKVGDCILENAPKIDKDEDKVESGVKRTDDIVEKIKEIKEKNQPCDSIDNEFLKQINSRYDDVPVISSDNLGLLIGYCNKTVFEDGKLKREEEIRAALFAREKASIPWELADDKDFKSRINAMKREFVDADVGLRISNNILENREGLKYQLIDKNTGKQRDYDKLDNNLKSELKAMGILTKEDWEKLDSDKLTAAVETYLNNKESEIYQRASNDVLKKDYYEKAIGDLPNTLLTNKQTEIISLDPLPETLDVEGLNDISQPITQYDIKIVKKDKEGDQSYYDWYYKNNPIFVVTTKDVAGKKQIDTQKPLTLYLKENPALVTTFDGGNFAKLRDALPPNARLAIAQKTLDNKYTFTTVNVVREAAPLPKPEYEIGIEDNKLKTITVDYNHYLEVERNSQGLITKLRLYSTEGYLDEFSYTRCEEGLTRNGLKDSVRVCSNLRSVDQTLLKDPKKAQAKDIVVGALTYKLKGAILKTGVLECADVMGAQDCNWLFSACDPVLCPPSRFQFNGRRVDNVVASGISGSILLGWNLWKAPYIPVAGGEIGICIPGVLAGFKNLRSIAQSYQQCLLVKKEKGENVGICDTIYNIGICKVVWREAYSFIQGGLIGALFKLFGTDVSGGGEYLFFYQNLKNTGEFADFLVNEYAVTFAQAFRGGSTKELGDTICEYALYGKLPGGGTFIEQLTRPEGPPQFTAILDEVPHADIGLTPTSDYSIFYHIYAGESYPEVRYAVYLRDVDEQITPPTIYVAPRFGLSGVSTGYLKRGDFVSDTIRLSDRPTGYDEVCVVINDVPKCGFGKVSSDFGVQYLQDKVVADQLANKNITSARECVPDSTLTSQFASASTLQIGAALGSKIVGSGLTQTGIVRKCSIKNPGLGTTPNQEPRWEPVGTCGKDSEGRSLGTCWLDRKSYNLLSEEAREKISMNLEEVNKLKAILDDLDGSIQIYAGPGYLNKKNLVYEIDIYIKNAKFNDDEIKILVDKATRLIKQYNDKIISKTLEPSLLQQAHFSIGEIKENIAHLLRAKETKEKQELAKQQTTTQTQQNQQQIPTQMRTIATIKISFKTPLYGVPINIYNPYASLLQTYIWNGNKWTGGEGSGEITELDYGYIQGLNFIESLILENYDAGSNFQSLKLVCGSTETEKTMIDISTLSQAQIQSIKPKPGFMKPMIDDAIKNCYQVEREEGIFKVTLIRSYIFDFIERDYTYSWDGDKWSIYNGKKITIMGYDNGFTQISEDANKIYLRGLEDIELYCNINKRSKNFVYRSNLISYLKNLIRDRDGCSYEGPHSAFSSQTQRYLAITTPLSTTPISVSPLDLIQGATFKIGTEELNINILSISSNNIDLMVTGYGKNLQTQLSIGDAKLFDFNEDNLFDLSIKLNSITNGKVALELRLPQ